MKYQWYCVFTVNKKEQKMFDYKNSSTDEMISHIKKSSSALITRMRTYHVKHNNPDIVKKIDSAREYVKLEKIQKRLKELENV